jgi:hypothetical protein
MKIIALFHWIISKDRALPHPKCYNPFRVFRQNLTKNNIFSILKPQP